MYIYINAYIHICKYTYGKYEIIHCRTDTDKFMHIHIYACIHTSIHVYVHPYMYTYSYTCMKVHAYLYRYLSVSMKD